MTSSISSTDFLLILQFLTSLIAQGFELLDSAYLGDYSYLDYLLGFLVLFLTFDFFDRLGGIQRLGSFSRRNKNGDDDNE